VADLSDFVPISFSEPNLVDAAIAQVRSGAVQTDGSILDIGPLSVNWMDPSVGQNVKKSGRTTGLTVGQVSAIDVTVNVSYSTKCGRGGGDTATFVDQFRITPGEFSAGGDSGSVIVEDFASTPGAVGLLFAGSSSSTIANRIENVLSAFGVAMVGGTPPPPPATGSISGTVTNSADSSPLGSATVVVEGTTYSDTTDGSGNYAINDFETGTYNVTASASGFESQTKPATVNEDQNTVVNFALNPITAGTNAIVECVTYTTSGGKNQDKHLASTVKVVDDFGDPVSGANVTIELSKDGSPFQTLTETTDTSGNAAFRVTNAADVCYSTDVTSVVASGLTFDGTEPSNGFAKGTDPTPDADCRSGGTDCGGAVFGKLIPADPQKMRAATAVKRRYEALLFLRSKEVVGVGVSAVNGEPVIEVYLRSGAPNVFARIPARVENIAVRPVVTGQFVARGQCQASQ